MISCNLHLTASYFVMLQDITKKDEHQLQLARLEWELRQRRELAGACSELVASKERVAAAIAAARSRLDALAPHLRDVLKSTKPLQEALALRLDEKRDEARIAALLPTTLLLLYANASAYSDAMGVKTVTVGQYYLHKIDILFLLSPIVIFFNHVNFIILLLFSPLW